MPPRTNAEIFWSWFSTVEDHLFSLESPDDPVFAMLSQKLKNVDSEITCKLGPTHIGEPQGKARREIAFVRDKYSDAFVDLLDTGSRYSFENWIIGTGFKPGTQGRIVAPCVNGRTFYAEDEPKYSFELTRRNCTIDATIYTDEKVNEDPTGYRHPVDAMLQYRLGECAYHTLLGNVSLKKRSEYRGKSKLKTINNIWSSFEMLLTDSERNDIANTISKNLPCVSTIRDDVTMRVIGHHALPSDNIYMRDLHHYGTGVDRTTLKAIASYSKGISAEELDRPTTASARLALADACWKKCQVSAARTLLSRALKDSRSATDKLVQGRAATFLKCRLPKHDISPETSKSFNLAMVEIMSNERASARHHLHQCIARDPNFEWPFRHLSTIYRAAGDLYSAELVARKAVAINPSYARGWAELALVLLQKHDPEYAVALNTACSLDREDDLVIATVQQADAAKKIGWNFRKERELKSSFARDTRFQSPLTALIDWAKSLPLFKDWMQAWG